MNQEQVLNKEQKVLKKQIKECLEGKDINSSLGVLSRIRVELEFQLKLSDYKKQYPELASFLDEWTVESPIYDDCGQGYTTKEITFNDGNIRLEHTWNRDMDKIYYFNEGERETSHDFFFLLEDNLILDIMKDIGLFGVQVKYFLDFILTELAFKYDECEMDNFLRSYFFDREVPDEYLKLLEVSLVSTQKSARNV